MSLMTAAHARRGYSLFEKLGDAAVAAGHLVGEAAQAARDACFAREIAALVIFQLSKEPPTETVVACERRLKVVQELDGFTALVKEMSDVVSSVIDLSDHRCKEAGAETRNLGTLTP